MIVKATHRFEDELQDIIESPYCPQYLKKSVKSTLSQISTFPESFPVRHFDRPKLREWRVCVIKKYVVLYFIQNGVAYVDHIYHGMQSFDKLLESQRIRRKFVVYAHSI